MVHRELIAYSLKHIARRKARSILTILSIFIGITTIFVFISFGQGLFDYVNGLKESSGADKVTILPRGIGAPGMDTTFSLNEEDLEAIKHTTGVLEATPLYAGVAEIQEGRTKRFVFLFGYDPRNDLVTEVFNVEISQGRLLREGDSSRVVLGYNYLVESRIFQRALTLNERIQINGKNAKVVGFFSSIGNPQDDSNIYVTNDYFEELYPTRAKKYNQIIARVDEKYIEQTIDRIERSLRTSRNLDEGKEDFFVASFQELLEQYTLVLDYVVYFVIFIALISVIVSAVNTANTTITSVLERVKEIGVMKAIGAKNTDVFGIFVFESGFLGFVAGVIGVLCGWMLTALAASVLSNLGWGFLTPHYSWQLFVACIMFATITGVVSGLIPAWRASRISPVSALRYE